MLEESLIADLVTDLPAAVRLQRLVSTLRNHFGCGAVGLLKLEHDILKPVALHGLVREALGRRFMVSQHPRLAAILASRNPVRFEPDCGLPDPYDGLLAEQPGQALPVHDCMGIALYIEGRCWGVLTLDALEAGSFSAAAVFELQRYSLLVEAAVRTTELEQANRALRLNHQADEQQFEPAAKLRYELIGQSKVLQQILQELTVVANSDLPVLLLGETGVGKELFARHLHRSSARASNPMIYLNCAALPESLAESELFGHNKGAFSGAHSERAGRFEAADGGTLFLDEVGELPLLVQAKLLRVLQNGEIQRLGSDKTRLVNVRLVAATNRDLKQQVKSGEFRADLYHRLSVYPLPIPPLRERRDDIPLLAGHFLELNRSRLGLRALRLAPAAELALLSYDWPGNVRELEHVISRAAIKALSQGAARSDIVTLGAELLDIDSVALAEHHTALNNPVQHNAAITLKQAVNQLQRHMIHQALTQHEGSWSQAARQLELDPSNLHKLAQRLGLK
ncbi:anaerobic nitric oxide reductase transcription regulator [Rheinheimera pacifica]|uniref:Anaerobic nitric oxide reductase transcription regulator n=1 Tax=Rheinheimera pacifica TaxID=173990 RepID=A0A1H6KEG8_9GAMM|nr:nitric oxide reductase transcriptional regulator NorR [Rheinheimera pacifica]SEH73679.1 anaerobic nitric oxide reductase transcription regulator [Rheinheimera pacifica]